jgi:hypothetical protein
VLAKSVAPDGNVAGIGPKGWEIDHPVKQWFVPPFPCTPSKGSPALTGIARIVAATLKLTATQTHSVVAVITDKADFNPTVLASKAPVSEFANNDPG